MVRREAQTEEPNFKVILWEIPRTYYVPEKLRFPAFMLFMFFKMSDLHVFNTA